jgi:glutamate-1-semialdehyde 2,1-aminomutase
MLAHDEPDWSALALDPERLRKLAERESAELSRRTPHSTELRTRAKVRMPRGIPTGFMGDLYPQEPIFAERGEGARFWDADGNEYLDFNLCDLSTICGHAHPALVEAISAQAARGVQFLLPGEDAEHVAAELGARLEQPLWQFTLSASLANVEALRVARAATGRERTIVFSGHYHGHIDDTLRPAADGVKEEDGFLGLGREAGAQTTEVEFNDLKGLERALSGGEVAAVMVEPALTNCGVVLPAPDFHAGIRELCDRHGTLLVADETHTQFAFWGGGTRRFRLRPDITTGGKGIAGGIPVGFYGMSEELGRFMESHPDSDFVAAAGVPTGGTLFANALSLAAARAALTTVLTEPAQTEMERLGGLLSDGLETRIQARGLPWCAHRFGARAGVCLQGEPPRTVAQADVSLAPLLAAAKRPFFANRGVWDAIATSGPSVSVAHTEADLDGYLGVFEEWLEAVTS